MLNCNKCLRLLPEESFFKRTDCPRGRTSACKDCEKKRGAENRIRFREKNRLYSKKHNQDPIYKAKRRIYMRDRYRKSEGVTPEQREKKRIRQNYNYANNKIIREKFICIGKTKRAIKRGILIPKKTCEYPNCKYPNLNIELHHWDYKQPMWVSWFCSQHHGLADRVRRAKELYNTNL